nr:hypothetical protein [Deltaproteobacteria bacterium]
PPCHRWRNQLSDCEALGIPGCSPGGIDKENAMMQRFGATAEDVCKKLVKRSNAYAIAGGAVPLYGYTNGETIKACRFAPGADKTCYPIEQDFMGPDVSSANCVYDANNDGIINYDDNSYYAFTVEYATVIPEGHCFCTANGPHTNVQWSMEGNIGQQSWELSMAYFAHKFPSGLKKAILEANHHKKPSQFTRRGQALYKSEAIYSSSSVLNPTNATTFDPEPTLQKWNPDNADAAQIDHIIPRVDNQGCLCGDVTPNNAAVVSLELNQTMSNISPKWNINRARMYEKYVTCTNPADAQYQAGSIARSSEMPFSQVRLQEDENTLCVSSDVEQPQQPPRTYIAAHPSADDETATAGCSAAGTSGLGGILLALFAVRRRKAQVARS